MAQHTAHDKQAGPSREFGAAVPGPQDVHDAWPGRGLHEAYEEAEDVKLGGCVAAEEAEDEERPYAETAWEPVAGPDDGNEEVGEGGADDGPYCEVGVHPAEFITGAKAKLRLHAGDIGV